MSRIFSASNVAPLLLAAVIAATGFSVRNAEIPVPPPPPETRPDTAAPILQSAYDALRAAEVRHERRLLDVIDPLAAEKRDAARLEEALKNGRGTGLASIGFELFVRDFRPRPKGTLKPASQTTRCQSCHHRPGPGGAGGLVDDYFAGRNPPALFGAGLIERLAAEITRELQRATGDALSFQGISFGSRSSPRGIDRDLVVKPFGRAGTWVSLEDSIDAMARETMGVTMTPGETVALSAFVRSLPMPGVVPPDPATAPDLHSRFLEGQRLFERVGCGGCHVPEWRLSDGTVIAPYTDLRRHDMGEALADGKSREWLTPPLWGMSATAPWLHDGHALASLQAAIIAHDGEALDARKAYESLDRDAQGTLRVFLLSLAPAPKLQVAGQ